MGGEDPDLTGLPDTLVNMYSKGPLHPFILSSPLLDPLHSADASDIVTPSTYITFADYHDLMLLIDSSTTRHAGLKTLSLLITTQYSAWEWYSYVPLALSVFHRSQSHLALY